MVLDVDTFLTTVYCLIDDAYREHAAPARAHLPGRPGKLSDSEVLTLCVLCQWQASGSERQFVAWAAKHWRSYFPHLVSQSAFNRRARNLYGVLAQLGDWIRSSVEAQLGYVSAYQIIDGVAVPLMRRCRGNRRRCFGTEADFGYGGSDRELYYGSKPWLPLTPAALSAVGWLDPRQPKSTGWPRRCSAGAKTRPRRRPPPTTWPRCSDRVTATVGCAMARAEECVVD